MNSLGAMLGVLRKYDTAGEEKVDAMTTPRGPRHRASRDVYRRRQMVAAAAVVTVIALAVLLMTSLLGSSPAPTTTTTTTVRPTTTTQAPTTTTTDAGLLPQTNQEPPTDSPSLTSRLAPMFHAIQGDNHALAMTVFFPESAYLQMKTGVLSNPAGDYQSRLVAFLDLDLATYQASLEPSPAATTLQVVNANSSLAHWVAPGTCENKMGYWHLPNVRMVYTQAGVTKSFGIASLISWRGVWYVVHLGPNPRPSNVGTIDQPALGPGTPGPGGGC